MPASIFKFDNVDQPLSGLPQELSTTISVREVTDKMQATLVERLDEAMGNSLKHCGMEKTVWTDLEVTVEGPIALEGLESNHVWA